MGRLLPVLAALALWGALAAAGSTEPRPRQAAGAPIDPAAVSPAAGSPGAVIAEHRYRIVGKLRLALVWAGRDDVGSARMTWRSDGTTSAIAFLVGSNPRRAPRNLNEWSYLREEVQPGHAEVFTFRSLGDDQDDEGGADTGDPMFGVSCTSVQDADVHSSQTTVPSRGATYWMFDRLLEQAAASPHWQEQRIARPAGASAGFLTALQHLLRAGGAGGRTLKSAPPVAYVYDNAVYDLSVRDARVLDATTIGTRNFDRLVRADFSIRKRTTDRVRRFAVTYVPDAIAPLPVQIFYQPSFWLRVELRLDEAAEVPADPAADSAMLSRMRAICAGAAR
jgi:hypothetical protein